MAEPNHPVDLSGMPVSVVAGMHKLPELPGQRPHTFNFGDDTQRINTSQRPARIPARVQRLGHLLVQTTKYSETPNRFDKTVEPGWPPFSASGLAQWGPPTTKDFLETDLKSARHELVSMITALRARNEFDISRLIGLLKVPTS